MTYFYVTIPGDFEGFHYYNFDKFSEKRKYFLRHFYSFTVERTTKETARRPYKTALSKANAKKSIFEEIIRRNYWRIYFWKYLYFTNCTFIYNTLLSKHLQWYCSCCLIYLVLSYSLKYYYHFLTDPNSYREIENYRLSWWQISEYARSTQMVN